MNFFSVVSDILKARTNKSLMCLLNIFGWKCLILAFVEWFNPLLHNVVHFSDVVLHLLDQFIDFSDDLHSLVNEGVDIITIPLELRQAWVKSIKHHLDTVLQKGLFYW